MVERFVRIEEVVVSITISSTKADSIPPGSAFFIFAPDDHTPPLAGAAEHSETGGGLEPIR